MKKNISNEVIHKEIDLIQSCINRMSNNSFMCKGWLVSLIVAIISLLTEKINRFNICLLILGVDSCFWWIDAMFLYQETLYRWKYEWVILNRNQTNKYLYDLNPHNKFMWLEKRKALFNVYPYKIHNSFYIIKIMFSKTLFPLYGGCFIITTILMIFKWF